MADREPAEAQLWVAESPTRDFRQARWLGQDLPKVESGWEVHVSPAAAGYRAFFAELVFPVDGLRLYVSTPTRVLGP